jgi:hypothetical protein
LAECKFNVKKNGVSITLVKNNAKENWTDIKPKAALINKPEKKKAAAKGGDETANAYGDLMGMMKDMYQNGDEKTK